MKPPFELYRECDIADQEGHVCSAENPEIAQQILVALNSYYGQDEARAKAQIASDIATRLLNR